MDDRPDDLVEIGYIARPHGVRGELRAVPYNPGSSTLEAAGEVYIDGQRYGLTAARPVKGAYLLAVRGVTDRTMAETLRGKPLAVHRDDIELDDDEVLLGDLIGCQVILEDGTSYGLIAAVETGLQDRLVIHHGAIERQLPVVDEFILSIDLDAQQVVVAPPEDLPEAPQRRRRG